MGVVVSLRAPRRGLVFLPFGIWSQDLVGFD